MKRHRLALALIGLLLTQIASPAQLPNAWQITDSSIAGSTLLYYTNQLTTDYLSASTNSTGGFHMTVIARLVDDSSGGPQTMAMAYGLGNKRFLIWFDLDGSGNLTANLDSAATYLLTTNGAGTTRYHTHEIIYNPTNGTARYLFDGQVISNNWSPSSFTLAAGNVHWGASASGGKGRMNFNLVTFAITNTIVVSYEAGTAGNPASAPDPTNSAPPWRLFKGAGAGTSLTNISPDTALLPVATTEAADQMTNTSARLNGQVNPRASPTMAWFEWGADTNYGNVTANQNVGSGVTFSNISAALNGLAGGLPYHYRLVVSNGFGIAEGADQSFSLAGFFPIEVSSLPGVRDSAVAWGDFNNDGWQDFLLTGNQHGIMNVSRLMQNTGNGFTNVTASVAPGLPAVNASSVAWGEYDNDGRLDFLLTGYSAFGAISQLWRNTGNGFTNVPVAGLPGVRQGSVAWGDYDNDGRQDFLLTGLSTDGAVSQLWRNTDSGFSRVVVPGLPGVSDSSVAWGDYDNDGWLDFLIAGYDGSDAYFQLWRNTGSGFTNLPNLKLGVPVTDGCVAWGDYDNDGRLDFLLTGLSDSLGAVSQIWRNTGTWFSNVTPSVAPGLRGVESSSVAWGDFDNDGRLDFLIAGTTNGLLSGEIAQLWRNTGSSFTNVSASVAPGLPPVAGGSGAWGDRDNDGRLDLLLTGSGQSEVWRNNLPISNAPPNAPTGLSVTVSNDVVTLNWNAPSDDHTPATGLNYNLRIGRTPGASDLLAPMTLGDGFRLLPVMGNAQSGTNAFFHLPQGPIYWSVQAIDTGFAGSTFATEQQFFIAPRLINPVRYPGGQFEFHFTNQTTLTFNVLVSTNVALSPSNWLNLGPALDLGGGYYRFTDAGATGQPRRYYLLRAQ